jgi:hypothetical protein
MTALFDCPRCGKETGPIHLCRGMSRRQQITRHLVAQQEKTTMHRLGRAPEGYRQWINPRPEAQTLHLTRTTGDQVRTLCGKPINPRWVESEYTQRTKCRTCWWMRAEDGDH